MYKEIAIRNNCENEYKIKWTIEKTITSMINYTDKEILSSYFSKELVITPKIFIKNIRYIVRSELAREFTAEIEETD